MGPFDTSIPMATWEWVVLGLVLAVAAAVWLFRKGRAHAKRALTDRYEAERAATDCGDCGADLAGVGGPGGGFKVVGLDRFLCETCAKQRERMRAANDMLRGGLRVESDPWLCCTCRRVLTATGAFHAEGKGPFCPSCFEVRYPAVAKLLNTTTSPTSSNTSSPSSRTG